MVLTSKDAKGSPHAEREVLLGKLVDVFPGDYGHRSVVCATAMPPAAANQGIHCSPDLSQNVRHPVVRLDPGQAAVRDGESLPKKIFKVLYHCLRKLIWRE